MGPCRWAHPHRPPPPSPPVLPPPAESPLLLLLLRRLSPFLVHFFASKRCGSTWARLESEYATKEASESESATRHASNGLEELVLGFAASRLQPPPRTFVGGGRPLHRRSSNPKEPPKRAFPPEHIAVLKEHKDVVKAIAFESDNMLWLGGVDKCIKAWQEGVCVATLQGQKVMFGQSLGGHKDAVTALMLAAGGTLLLGSASNSIKCWLNNGCVATCTAHGRIIHALVLYRAGGSLWSASQDKTIKEWAGSVCQRTLKGREECVLSLALGPDGLLYSASGDATIKR
eukprot:jgi/Mesen1/7323/ME000376S06494